MADDDKNKSDEFFRLMAEDDNQAADQGIENPLAKDEILFRDKNGKIKVLKGDQVSDLSAQKDKAPAPVKEVKVATISPPKPSLPKVEPLNLDQEVERVVQKSQVSFSDDQAKKRFKNIILSRLKDVRDQIEVREMLLSPPAERGMGFDNQTVDRILQIINQEFEQLEGRLRQAVSQEPFAELQAEAEKLLTKSPGPAPPELLFSPPEKPPSKIVSQPETKRPEVEKIESTAPKPPIKPVAEPPVKPVSFRKPVAPLGEKPKIEDVKFKPKLTGPIGEIESLTLTDFRRLADTPQQATDKIIEKIKILEEESFSQLIQAIKAWQQSKVNRLYLEVGQESMAAKKPVAEVIADRQQSQQPTLTEKEFEAISDLNQKLRH